MIFGAALLYGDGVITPAISVLSAVEGLEVATTVLKPGIVPITCVILVGLFMVQKKGTAGIGRVFGPIMVVWFLTLALLGIGQIVQDPRCSWRSIPATPSRSSCDNGGQAFFMLGAVVLVITGGEALYADMGHFGRRPIRIAWYLFVLPALLLNYFGQGALVLDAPRRSEQQPVLRDGAVDAHLSDGGPLDDGHDHRFAGPDIGGLFAHATGHPARLFPPRDDRAHLGRSRGADLHPEINSALMVACVWLVLTFKESTALASAYGIAVTGTMAITSIIYFLVLTEDLGLAFMEGGPVVGMFLVFDLAFFGANLLKFFSGGWFPMGLAMIIFLMMTTWKKGRALLAKNIADRLLPIDVFLADLREINATRVNGTAVFMSSNPNGVPIVLLHHWKHNRVLHKTIVLLSVVSENLPEVPLERRVVVKDLGQGFWHCTAYYGFMETPNVPDIMERAGEYNGVPYMPGETSYFLGRETLLATKKSGMHKWRKTLFSFISRNSRSATQYFGIPPDRVVELGMQIDL